MNKNASVDKISQGGLLPSRSFRILSYNIQSGLPAKNFSGYIHSSWQHVLPTQKRNINLQAISELLMDYDLVALQEVDAGSMRTGYVNQVQYLAKQAGFPYWYLQVNRNLGKIAKHSNAVLTRYSPSQVINHKLPGMIPGRGAIELHYGDINNPLVFVIVHLALGKTARHQQLDYIASLLHGQKNVILMGDMNCQWHELAKSNLLKHHQLRSANEIFNTYPSWRPKKIIDHILISPSVQVLDVSVPNLNFSDHLPVALDILLPEFKNP